MRGSTLRRRLVLAFATLAGVVLLGVALAVVVSARLYGAQERVVDTIFGGYSASTTFSQALVDQETGFRGFALTGDEQFLESYTEGRERAERAIARMARAERDFPMLRDGRVAVEQASDEWHASVVEPAIAAVRAGQRPDEADLEAGRRSLDDVQAAVRDYRRQLLDLRADSVDQLREEVVWLFVVLGSAMALLLATAGLAWVALRRWVTDPLQQLGAEVDRVEAGDLSRQVSVEQAPEEIRILAEQIESMRVRILHEFALAEQSRTEALEARALVEEQAEDLRRSNAELEQFAYVASHDLQEPLRKVASFCQLIERRYKGQLDERGEQYIEFAVDGAKRMQQLINDLLAFSRVGRVSSDLATVDLEQVLAQALRQLEATLEEADAVVTHDPLPTVRGEASLLVQLLQNLIGNGVKFRSDQPPRVHIAVRRAPGDDHLWEFSCSDNGIGIDEQYQDKIFVIFQRLHGRDTYGGTGIGLAMCKKIVEHHGGRLWLDNQAADGSTGGATFRWTLPVDADATPAGPAGAAGTDTEGRTAHDAAAGAAGRDLARGGRPG